MDKIPFTFYDWFGYLASGGVVCLGTAFANGIDSPITAANSVGVWSSMVWLVVIYVTGHLNAHMAQTVIEYGLLRCILGMPEKRLLTERDVPWWGHVFGDYFQPLDPAELKRLRERDEEGNIGAPSSLFRVAFDTVKNIPATKWRLDIFLTQYGFHRNMCFAVLLVWLQFLFLERPDFAFDNNVTNFFVGLVIVYLLFLRYLKFIRHYTREVFTSYAFQVDPQ